MKPTVNRSARALAMHVLHDTLVTRKPLEDAWASHPFTGSEADARFARHLVLTTLRHLGQLDALIATYLEKPLPAKRAWVMNALRLGLVQLLLLKTPPHAAVHETVEALKQSPDRGLAGLVNAVLQKAARTPPPLPEPLQNVPDWPRRRWTEYYGEAMVATMAAVAAAPPPLDVNGGEALPDATRLDAQIQRLAPTHDAVEDLPGYATGAFFIQDLAASYPARLLGDVAGKDVLDLCAAPGGKTAQLLRGGAKVTALDRSPARMAILRQNMRRLRYAPEIIVADAFVWQPTCQYDAVLLDAPCSATGTWRRHPEVVRLITVDDIAKLNALQRRLLTRAWHWVKPGGTLVYCVCSLEHEEGEAQQEWFVATHADAQIMPPHPSMEIPAVAVKNGAVRTLPGYFAENGGMDGFFAVCFSKSA